MFNCCNFNHSKKIRIFLCIFYITISMIDNISSTFACSLRVKSYTTSAIKFSCCSIFIGTVLQLPIHCNAIEERQVQVQVQGQGQGQVESQSALTTRQKIIRSTNKALANNKVLETIRKADQLYDDESDSLTTQALLLIPILDMKDEVRK